MAAASEHFYFHHIPDLPYLGGDLRGLLGGGGNLHQPYLFPVLSLTPWALCL